MLLSMDYNLILKEKYSDVNGQLVLTHELPTGKASKEAPSTTR